MNTLIVRAESELDYTHDWTDWLAAGDSIATHSWAISPTGPALQNASSATVVASGFSPGVVYRLRETITTNAGLTEARDVVLRCLK